MEARPDSSQNEASNGFFGDSHVVHSLATLRSREAVSRQRSFATVLTDSDPHEEVLALPVPFYPNQLEPM